MEKIQRLLVLGVVGLFLNAGVGIVGLMTRSNAAHAEDASSKAPIAVVLTDTSGKPLSLCPVSDTESELAVRAYTSAAVPRR